jgi:hypothetical protein
MFMPILKRCFSQRRKGRKGKKVEQAPSPALLKEQPLEGCSTFSSFLQRFKMVRGIHPAP